MRSLLFFSLLTLSFVMQAQNCADGLWNGQEFKIDCGGPDCPPCIPLMYDGEYTVFGNLEIFLTLPPYLFSEAELAEGIYYELGNGFTTVCAELVDCQPFLEIVEDQDLTLDVYKKNLDGEVLGFGRLLVESQCLSCQPQQSTNNCPSGDGLELTFEKQEQENGYMVKINLSNGTPPYRVFDQNYELYYEDGIGDSTFYMGLFPDTFDLNLRVSDFWGCKANIEIINTIDSMMVDSMVMDSMNMDSTVMDTMVIDTFSASIQNLSFQQTTALPLYPTLFDQQVNIALPMNVANSPIQQFSAISMDGMVIDLLQNNKWQINHTEFIELNAAYLPSGLWYFLIEMEGQRFVAKGVKL